MAAQVVIPRLLQRPDRSFFLFGPRGTGKSTWLQQVLPEALRLDLLNSSLYLELSRDPHRLEALVAGRPAGTWVVLDEIQEGWGTLFISFSYGLAFISLIAIATPLSPTPT